MMEPNEFFHLWLYSVPAMIFLAGVASKLLISDDEPRDNRGLVCHRTLMERKLIRFNIFVGFVIWPVAIPMTIAFYSVYGLYMLGCFVGKGGKNANS